MPSDAEQERTRMNNKPYTLDGMAFYKLWKEHSDRGAPSFTFDSITNLAQPGKVVYEPILPPQEAFVEGRYDAYYAADMEMAERGNVFAAANPDATFIETLYYLIHGVTIHDKASFSVTETSGHNRPVGEIPYNARPKL
jgi:hypothetical protein